MHINIFMYRIIYCVTNAVNKYIHCSYDQKLDVILIPSINVLYT
jgi:hypothetical protein